jgi:hypothetical protein
MEMLMIRNTKMLLGAALFTALLPWAGAVPAMAVENPIAAEKNPPGDIPDTQVFVVYSSPAGFSMKVPEGWSRADRSDGATFADKYDTIEVSVAPASRAPTVASVKAGEVKSLAATDRAVSIGAIKAVKLAGGPAVEIDYTANSDPNIVTGQQIRLERARYLVFGKGKLVTLDVAAPKGADNVDQWKLMSNSVRIR